MNEFVTPEDLKTYAVQVLPFLSTVLWMLYIAWPKKTPVSDILQSLLKELNEDTTYSDKGPKETLETKKAYFEICKKGQHFNGTGEHYWASLKSVTSPGDVYHTLSKSEKKTLRKLMEQKMAAARAFNVAKIQDATVKGLSA